MPKMPWTKRAEGGKLRRAFLGFAPVVLLLAVAGFVRNKLRGNRRDDTTDR